MRQFYKQTKMVLRPPRLSRTVTWRNKKVSKYTPAIEDKKHLEQNKD